MSFYALFSITALDRIFFSTFVRCLLSRKEPKLGFQWKFSRKISLKSKSVSEKIRKSSVNHKIQESGKLLRAASFKTDPKVQLNPINTCWLSICIIRHYSREYFLSKIVEKAKIKRKSYETSTGSSQFALIFFFPGSIFFSIFPFSCEKLSNFHSLSAIVIFFGIEKRENFFWRL